MHYPDPCLGRPPLIKNVLPSLSLEAWDVCTSFQKAFVFVKNSTDVFPGMAFEGLRIAD